MRSIEILDRWIAPTHYRSRFYINYLFKLFWLQNQGKNKIFEKCRDTFQRCQKLFPDEEICLSGLNCLGGGLLLQLSLYGEIVNLEPLIDLTSAYLQLDYLLDAMPNDCKPLALGVADKFLEVVDNDIKCLTDGLALKSLDSNIPILGDYRRMIQNDVEVVLAAKQVLEDEIVSSKIQTVSGLDRNAYLDICRKKGGSTGILIYRVCTSGVKERRLENSVDIDDSIMYRVGECCQLVDDLIDVHRDLSMGIHTAATCDLTASGNLDTYFEFLLELLDSLPSSCNLMRYAFLIVSLYSISSGKILSPKMTRLVEPYFLLDSRFGLSMKGIARQMFT